MVTEKVKNLLDLAYRAIEPDHRTLGLPLLMVIRDHKLQMIIPGKQLEDDICIMNYSSKMLTKGLSDIEWTTLHKNLIKHRKELKN